MSESNATVGAVKRAPRQSLPPPLPRAGIVRTLSHSYLATATTTATIFAFESISAVLDFNRIAPSFSAPPALIQIPDLSLSLSARAVLV